MLISDYSLVHGSEEKPTAAASLLSHSPWQPATNFYIPLGVSFNGNRPHVLLNILSIQCSISHFWLIKPHYSPNFALKYKIQL